MKPNPSRVPNMGATNKSSVVLLGVMCSRPRHRKMRGKISTRCLQLIRPHETFTGHVHHKLYFEDQGFVRITQRHQPQCRWRLNGANMPSQPRSTVRQHANRHPSEGESSFLLRPWINVVDRREPRIKVEQCLRRTNALLTLGRWYWTHSCYKGPIWKKRTRSILEGQFYFRQEIGKNRGTFGRRGSFHVGPSRQDNSVECGYCSKFGHHNEEFQKKKSESVSTSRQLIICATNSNYEDYGGMFFMRHRANSMSASGPTSTSNSDNLWFVDSDAWNHMTLSCLLRVVIVAWVGWEPPRLWTRRNKNSKAIENMN